MSEVKNYNPDCLFCKILKGEIPSTKVCEDEQCYAFRDIAPHAPTHVLVIPKTHLTSMEEIGEENAGLVAHMMTVIPQIAKGEGLENGWRLVSNVGEDGGQTVKHLHFHILGGKKLIGQMG